MRTYILLAVIPSFSSSRRKKDTYTHLHLYKLKLLLLLLLLLRVIFYVFVSAIIHAGKVGKPLLMVHGWPGSVWEFYKIIPMLINPQDDDDNVFEVICPSIPGYGFSEIPHQKGCFICYIRLVLEYWKT